MTAAWIIVLLIVAFISARIYRSTKMWWLFLSTIMAGLLVGMLSKEVSISKKDNTTSYTQLIDLNNSLDVNLDCMQPTFVTEVLSYSAVVGYNIDFTEKVFNKPISIYHTKTRDSPSYEDSS